MIAASNVTMQFGAKPLFENISVKFANGNRYGLIGANGSGKSTFMKILSGELEPSTGNVSVDPDMRVGKLRQDQFAYEQFSVIDTVIMGHERLWQVKAERDRIYGLADMSEEDGMKVAILGANGIGKTTLLKCLMNEYSVDSGLIKWSENVNIGYYAQDHADWFKSDLTVFEWMSQWK